METFQFFHKHSPVSSLTKPPTQKKVKFGTLGPNVGGLGRVFQDFYKSLFLWRSPRRPLCHLVYSHIKRWCVLDGVKTWRTNEPTDGQGDSRSMMLNKSINSSLTNIPAKQIGLRFNINLVHHRMFCKICFLFSFLCFSPQTFDDYPAPSASSSYLHMIIPPLSPPKLPLSPRESVHESIVSPELDVWTPSWVLLSHKHIRNSKTGIFYNGMFQGWWVGGGDVFDCTYV